MSVCAQAPGRIDGVLFYCSLGMLIMNRSASLVMHAAQGACPIGMRHGGLVEAFVGAPAP